MIRVTWLARPGVCSRCRMDEWAVEDLLDGAQKRPAPLPSFAHVDGSSGGGSMVVVLPGGNHLDDVEWVNHQLAHWDDVILFITSDEGALFPVDRLSHPNLRLWVQTPRPEVAYPAGSQFFGVGSGRAWLSSSEVAGTSKTSRLFLAGQRTHERRVDAFSAARRVKGAHVVETAQFMAGLPRPTYLRELAAAWWAPAPSGILTQDSFRFYEALEMGAIPIPDGLRPDGQGRDYWGMVAPGLLIEPIKDWHRLASLIDSSELLGREHIQLHMHEWWHGRRREMARTLGRQVGDTSHPLTVIIPTSPIPTHPDLSVLDETIRSVRERTDAEILLTCDWPRPELQHRLPDYLEYLRRVMLKAERDWWNVTPIMMSKFCHQVEMLRRVLPSVDSEYVMYVEHDTPLVGELNVEEVLAAMRRADLNVMRLYHESAIHPEHQHLMTGTVHSDGWLPTMQWSQRPHIAKKTFYEKRVMRLFDTSARCMIEDAMFGIVEGAWLTNGHDGWNSWRIGIWHPQGNIQRSTHLDGRGEDPKFDELFKFRYAGGERPAGAPAGQAP